MTWKTRVTAHLEIMRPYTLSYAGLLALAGASSASQRNLSIARALQAPAVTMCGWLAGHYVGDYFDRDIDALSKPGRPLPSGRVSPREALVSMIVLILSGNLAALKLGARSLLIAVLTTCLGIAYSKVFKSMALLGNLDRGVLGACAVVFGACTAAERVPLSALELAGATIAHDGATNLVGAVRDVEGDAAMGCNTVPVVYGVGRAVQIAAALAGMALILGLSSLQRSRAGRLALALFGAASAVDVVVYGNLLLRRGAVTRTEALGAHKLLVLERNLLACAFIAVRAPKLAVSLLSVAAPLSLVLQSKMRNRHELSPADLP
jgi:4-hydroxybenzoate polyprenyltransferase/geranylgeranylglycerol-phosphate geranylgeranyltransferase